MTTKLEAINRMLSCVGQSPLKTLEGTKSYYTVSAEQMLDDECQRVLMTGWDFNVDEHYELKPDVNNTIYVTYDMLSVQLPQRYRNRYVVRKGKLYDKLKQSYEITRNIPVRIIWDLPFEDLPENFKRYVTMSSAYKFCKRVLGSENTCAYTREDLAEAYADLLGYELETGNYSIIPEMRNHIIRGDI